MLDIKLIRENPDLIKKSQKKRGFPEEDVDKVFSLDKQWRELKDEVDKLRNKRNIISKEINEAKKEGKNAKELLEEARKIPSLLAKKEKSMDELKEKRDSLLKEMPNLVDKSVPVGDATHNKVIKNFGKIKKFSFQPKDHADILETLNLLDTKKASEYLRNYKWSSYRDYINIPNFPTVTQRGFFLNFFGNTQKCGEVIKDWISWKAKKTAIDPKVTE